MARAKRYSNWKTVADSFFYCVCVEFFIEFEATRPSVGIILCLLFSICSLLFIALMYDTISAIKILMFFPTYMLK